MKIDSDKLIKGIGITCGVIGTLASAVGGVLSKKQQDTLIKETADKAAREAVSNLINKEG